jgi:hypothetical protein
MTLKEDMEDHLKMTHIRTFVFQLVKRVQTSTILLSEL